MDKTTLESIDRFYKGRFSLNDYRATQTMFSKSEGNEELYHAMRNQWDESISEESNVTDPELSKILDQIHQKQNKSKPRLSRKKLFHIYKQCAAILLLPLITGFLLLFLQQQNKSVTAAAEIKCPMGVRTKFTLPDGTTGFLNGGSTLRYETNMENNRWVELNGEAYFDVTKDPNNPFVVSTQELDIKVLGTIFNVYAYPNEKNHQIILNEGAVEIYNDSGEKVDKLSPNEMITYNKTSDKYKKENIEAWKYTAWTEGKLILRNESFTEVKKRMERWYNVEIVLRDEKLANYKFHATFEDEKIEQVLRLLSITAPFQFEEDKRDTNQGEIYKKRRFIIRFDKNRARGF